jgi:hypothetical protein
MIGTFMLRGTSFSVFFPKNSVSGVRVVPRTAGKQIGWTRWFVTRELGCPAYLRYIDHPEPTLATSESVIRTDSEAASGMGLVVLRRIGQGRLAGHRDQNVTTIGSKPFEVNRDLVLVGQLVVKETDNGKTGDVIIGVVARHL